MTPVFVFLVICGAIAVWFLLSGIFRPFGRFLGRIWDDAYCEIKEEEDKKDKE